jgi:hypothetical protein
VSTQDVWCRQKRLKVVTQGQQHEPLTTLAHLRGHWLWLVWRERVSRRVVAPRALCPVRLGAALARAFTGAISATLCALGAPSRRLCGGQRWRGVRRSLTGGLGLGKPGAAM